MLTIADLKKSFYLCYGKGMLVETIDYVNYCK